MAAFQWANDANPVSVTARFTVPEENRPNLINIPVLELPTVDMSEDNVTQLRQIAHACEEFGFFQLINHGIPEGLCQNVLNVIREFFHLTSEEKAEMLSTTHMEDGKIYKYYIKDQRSEELIFMWGEAFFHTWHPVNPSYINNLPINPPTYREIVASYIKNVALVITKLLSLISQSLGLPQNYLQGTLGENSERTAQSNYYPPCPDPGLTLGLRDHTDLKILTVLLADENIPGLQVQNSGQWFAVNVAPRALIVNVADQLQVLSNDKYKSVCHRVVNNETEGRTSFALFVGPEKHGRISPIEELLDDDNPPLYRPYLFSDFMEEFRNQAGKRRMVKEHFRIRSDGSGPSNCRLATKPAVLRSRRYVANNQKKSCATSVLYG